jgi:hypothetical protein
MPSAVHESLHVLAPQVYAPHAVLAPSTHAPFPSQVRVVCLPLVHASPHDVVVGG